GRARRTARWCRAGSILAEAAHRLVPIVDRWGAEDPEARARPLAHGVLLERGADHLGLGAPGPLGEAFDPLLERPGQVHGRLQHPRHLTIHSTIRSGRVPVRRAGTDPGPV